MTIPRRMQIEHHTPAEQAIRAAMAAVEAVGADVRLTDAVVLLEAAGQSLADFVDGSPLIRRTVQSVQQQAGQQVAWLIETLDPRFATRYFVDVGEWCDNPQHARRFQDQTAAEKVRLGLYSPYNCRSAEHMWTA